MSRYRIKTIQGETFECSFSGAWTDGIQFMFRIPQSVHEELLALDAADSSGVQLTRRVTEAIRLIADETAGGIILCSTGLKGQIIEAGVISNAPIVLIIIKFPSDGVKVSSGNEAGVRWIKYTITKYGRTKEYTIRSNDQFTIEMDWGDEPTGLSGGDDAHNLASFFNITEATEYTALTPAEAIAIARDCQYNVMSADWPIPTWLPTGVTEAQVESAAEGLGIPYHEPTQTA